MTIFPKAPLLSPAAMREIERARSDSFKEALLAIARSRAKAAKVEEAKRKAQQNINRPQFSPGYKPIDEFKMAAERMEARDRLEATLLRQLDDEIAANEAEMKRRQSFQRSMLESAPNSG